MLTEQKTSKELIKNLRDGEKYLHTLAEKIGDLADKHEFPAMIAEIKKLKGSEKITVAGLQKKYKIGYARATRLFDELKSKEIV